MPVEYEVIERNSEYEIRRCEDHYEVQRRGDGTTLTIESGVEGQRGPAGPEGPAGPAGPAPSLDSVGALFAEWDALHPKTFEYHTPGAVSVIDFNHPLPFLPNVQLIDSAGTVLLVAPILTPGHVHIDLGGAVMSATVLLS